MAIVVGSNGALEYFDTFAALARYNELHASDTVESYIEEPETPSVVTMQLTNADADTIVGIDSTQGKRICIIIYRKLNTRHARRELLICSNRQSYSRS